MGTHRKALALAAGMVALGIWQSGSALGGSFTWDGAPDGGGASVDNLITTGSNWIGDVAPNISSGTGDDWFFTNTAAQTSVGTPLGGGRVNSINFVPGALAYTVAGTDATDDLGNASTTSVFQNSTNLETLNIGLNVSGGKIVVGAGSGGVAQGADGASHYLYSTTTMEMDLGANYVLGSSTHLARNQQWNVYGIDGVNSTTSSAAGKLMLGGAAGTGTSVSGGNAIINFSGTVQVWSGAVRVQNNNALGATNVTGKLYVHGTFVASSAANAQLSGGYEHGFGALELQNNISIGQRVRFDSRIGDVADFDHIVNVSDNNTIASSTFQIGGAGHFNIDSLGGKLQIGTVGTGNNLHVSDGARSDNGGPGIVNSVWTFRGAGDIDLEAKLGQELGFSGTFAGQEGMVASALRKQGSGNLFLGASTNDWDGGTMLDGGTIKVLTGGNFSTVGSKIHIAGGATLDVSAIAVLTLGASNTLSGSGAVTGLVSMAGGAISPGGTDSLSVDPSNLLNDLMVVTGGLGTETINGGLSIGAGSTLNYDLDPNNPASTLDDSLVVAGALDMSSNPAVNVNVSTALSGGGNLAIGDYLLVHYGTDLGAMNATINAPLAAGLGASIVDDGSNLFLHVGAVPEPTSIGLLSIGAIGLMRRRRR